jgi:hypothetical protein
MAQRGGRKRSPALEDDCTVKEAGLTNHVIAETLCKVGITSRRRSGWLVASGDAMKIVKGSHK